MWVGPYCGPNGASGVRNSRVKFGDDCQSQLRHFRAELLNTFVGLTLVKVLVIFLGDLFTASCTLHY